MPSRMSFTTYFGVTFSITATCATLKASFISTPIGTVGEPAWSTALNSAAMPSKKFDTHSSRCAVSCYQSNNVRNRSMSQSVSTTLVHPLHLMARFIRCRVSSREWCGYLSASLCAVSISCCARSSQMAHRAQRSSSVCPTINLPSMGSEAARVDQVCEAVLVDISGDRRTEIEAQIRRTTRSLNPARRLDPTSVRGIERCPGHGSKASRAASRQLRHHSS